MSSKPHTPDTAGITTAEPQNKSNTRRGMLIAGDIIVFLIFAITGMRSHGEQLSISKVLITAAPFVVAWFIMSPLLGAFRREVETQPKKMLLRTLLAWICAWPVALLFRGLIEWRFPPVSFALVTLITNIVFLEVWRGLFAFVANRISKR